ncbi:anthranilate phosphoribosyltransferase, partial [Neobacillus drentensis]
LKGEKGAYRDTVLLNSGLGIYTAGKANSIQDGINVAKEIIDSGAAYEKLTTLIEKSQAAGQKEAI